MRVETENGLVYDSNDSRCRQLIKQVKEEGGSDSVAIIKCFDAKKGHPSIYYGIYDSSEPEKSIKAIMSGGADFYSALRFWQDEL